MFVGMGMAAFLEREHAGHRCRDARNVDDLTQPGAERAPTPARSPARPRSSVTTMPTARRAALAVTNAINIAHAGRRSAQGAGAGLRSSAGGDPFHEHPAGRAGAPRGVASVVPAKERVLELEVPVAFTMPSVQLWTGGDSHTPGAASSAGRALRSQRRGREFDPPAVHHYLRSRSQAKVARRSWRRGPARDISGAPAALRAQPQPAQYSSPNLCVSIVEMWRSQAMAARRPYAARRCRRISTTIGRSETAMMPSATSVKLLRTIGTLPNANPAIVQMPTQITPPATL